MCVSIGLASMCSPAGVCNTNVVAIGNEGFLLDEVETIGLFTLGCILGNHLSEEKSMVRIS